METRRIQDSELSPVASEAIAPRSRIRRNGRVPHSAFTDPRLDGLSVLARFVLVTAHAHAVRDESQRIDGEPVASVGWLWTADGGLCTVGWFADKTGTNDRSAVIAAITALHVAGLFTLSDALVWGVPGWEAESTPRIRRLRERQRKAKAALAATVEEDLDFYAFERKTPDVCVPTVRPNAAARAKAGPKSVGASDSAIAERDNRRPTGRT